MRISENFAKYLGIEGREPDPQLLLVLVSSHINNTANYSAVAIKIPRQQFRSVFVAVNVVDVIWQIFVTSYIYALRFRLKA